MEQTAASSPCLIECTMIICAYVGCVTESKLLCSPTEERIRCLTVGNLDLYVRNQKISKGLYTYLETILRYYDHARAASARRAAASTEA